MLMYPTPVEQHRKQTKHGHVPEFILLPQARIGQVLTGHQAQAQNNNSPYGVRAVILQYVVACAQGLLTDVLFVSFGIH